MEPKEKKGLEVIQEELSIRLVICSERFHDYQVYNEIHAFLEEHGVKATERLGGSKVLLGRVIDAI